MTTGDDFGYDSHEFGPKERSVGSGADTHGYLELLDLSVDNAATLFDDFKPIQIPRGFRSLGNGDGDRVTEGFIRSSNECNLVVDRVGHACSSEVLCQNGCLV
jgi:hypothetical protein